MAFFLDKKIKKAHKREKIRKRLLRYLMSKYSAISRGLKPSRSGSQAVCFCLEMNKREGRVALMAAASA